MSTDLREEGPWSGSNFPHSSLVAAFSSKFLAGRYRRSPDFFFLWGHVRKVVNVFA